MRSKRWLWLLLLLPVLLIAGFLVWAATPLGPMPEALQALASGPDVTVQTEPWLAFQPVATAPATGFVLYPGGRVDYRSYAPTARAIAAQGYLVVIPSMPLSLAVLAPDRAAEVMAAFPEIETWVIGGHSLGGAMAARYVYQNPGTAAGLVLWASYPPSSDDLSGRTDLAVLSLYGTLDSQAGEGILASRTILPADTAWVVIEGGNHAQFGWYGPQPGDRPATISREVQQVQIVEATVGFLASLR
jgi:pimeloyl-ACP methyl ester carboxylesterase